MLRMFSRCTCTIDADMCSTITRGSLHIQVLLHLVFAVYRFHEDHLPTLYCAQVALHCVPQKNLAEEVPNPSFKARHSMTTWCSLLVGVITVCFILSYRPLLSVTHAPGASRAISSGEIFRGGVAQHLGPLISHRKQFVLQIHNGSRLGTRGTATHSVCSATSSTDHRHSGFLTLQGPHGRTCGEWAFCAFPPSILFCSAASLQPVEANRSSEGKLKIHMAWS